MVFKRTAIKRRKKLRRPLNRRRKLFHKPRRFMKDIMTVKRFTSGRYLTVYATSQSAGATFTFNDANNLMYCATPAGIGTSYFSYAGCFNLNDVPNSSEFTALFDAYRINCVVFRIYPVATESATAGSASTSGPAQNGWIHSVIDYDDYAVITASDVGMDELRQYPSYKVKNLASYRPIKRKIYPKLLMAGQSTGGFNMAIQQRPKWIDQANPSCLHYGFKFVIEILNTGNSASYHYFKIEPIYYMSFKNMR